MIVDGIVEPIEDKQIVGELGVKVFIAQTALNMAGGRRVFVSAARQDIAVAIKAIDAFDPLRIHQVGGVPAARSVKDDVERSVIWFGPRLGAGGERKTKRNSHAEAREPAEL